MPRRLATSLLLLVAVACARQPGAPTFIVDVDSDGNDDVVLLTKEPSIKLLARASLKAGTSKKNDFKVRATGGSTHSSTCASV